MPQLDIHADDYALTVHTSQDILACLKAGKLDSISIVPNTACFRACMDLFYEAIPELPFLPLMSVHLDFVEGHTMAGASRIPLLSDADTGLMRLSWGKLFMLSYHPVKRKAAFSQLKKEIKAQIAFGDQAIRKSIELAKAHGIPCKQVGLRIDSHQHAHMIPIVWEALVSVIAEEGYWVEYIRNSKEVLGAFISEIPLWKTFRPVNLIKNRLLSLYSNRVDRYIKKHKLTQMYLWGLIMSGRMDYDRVVRLYPKVIGKAEKDGRTLEVLFHPGLALREEVTRELGEEAASAFYLSKNRKIEKDTVMRLCLHS